MSCKVQAERPAVPLPECSGIAVNEILEIHRALVTFFSTTPDSIPDLGLRDASLLERAVSHPFTGDAGQVVVLRKPSALLQGLIDELPFHDGNVQTSFIAMLLLLDECGLVPNRVSFDAFFAFFAALHEHRLDSLTASQPNSGKQKGSSKECTELSLILRWLGAHTRPEPVRDHPMTCVELERLLRKHGFQTVVARGTDGTFLEIAREEPGQKKRMFHLPGTKDRPVSAPMTRLQVPQGHGLFSLTSMREVRMACGLDAALFYDRRARIDSFIRQYQTLLVRLGRL